MVGQGMADDYAALIQENKRLVAENERLKKALEKALADLPKTDPRLTSRIDAAERNLQDMYLKRRGTMIDDYYGWCAVCGRERVAVRDGLDTCDFCLRGV
jgi:regulator of replication initiation timing